MQQPNSLKTRLSIHLKIKLFCPNHERDFCPFVGHGDYQTISAKVQIVEQRTLTPVLALNFFHDNGQGVHFIGQAFGNGCDAQHLLEPTC
jgi:hypothetical protein